jgi:hypothetical protein
MESASTERIDQHSELAKDFIERVLELKWVFVSDESLLADFTDDDDVTKLNRKIFEVHRVDVSDVSDGNLADIFDRIANKKTSQPPN